MTVADPTALVYRAQRVGRVTGAGRTGVQGWYGERGTTPPRLTYAVAGRGDRLGDHRRQNRVVTTTTSYTLLWSASMMRDSKTGVQTGSNTHTETAH